MSATPSPTPRVAADEEPPPGVVELREDAPLKSSSWGGGGGGAGAGGRYCAGPKFIIGCFGALSAAITVALLTQIYYGDYEVVPHGSVACDAARCSRAGTDALKAGGSALDAAAAAALCLAVVAPHRAGLDASGSLMLWEYRKSRTQKPLLAEWGGGAGGGGKAPSEGGRPPRLPVALAALHARFGRLPWADLLQPALQVASAGFPVSEELAAAAGSDGVAGAGRDLLQPELARYLRTLTQNTSEELSSWWAAQSRVSLAEAGAARAGGWRLFSGGAGAVAAALRRLLERADRDLDPDKELFQAVSTMRQLQQAGEWVEGARAATGLAAVDREDVYVSLVMGMSTPLDWGRRTADGWVRDDGAVDGLTPAILVEDDVCGARFVVGAGGGSSALVEVLWALARARPLRAAIEAPRALLAADGAVALEAERSPGPSAGALRYLAGAGAGAAASASRPYPSVNAVRQRGDGLASHADSRAGGLASRF